MKKEVENVVKFEFVNLGLSVKWANMNLGAQKPEEYGDYFVGGSVISDENGRMPSKDEFVELINNCTWEWVEQNGHAGYRVSSKINENSIFLPAAGLIACDKLYNAEKLGYYLTSTRNNNPVATVELLMSKKSIEIYLAGSYKRSVRLVSK